ncbi:MAG: DNA translocase FtsK, partial [Myxococcota bacterium]
APDDDDENAPDPEATVAAPEDEARISAPDPALVAALARDVTPSAAPVEVEAEAATETTSPHPAAEVSPNPPRRSSRSSGAVLVAPDDLTTALPTEPADDASPSEEPTIVDTSKEASTTKARRRRGRDTGAFALPAADFLSPAESDARGHDPVRLKEMARLLEKTLLDYKVEGRVQEIHPGPTVTMFEVSPAPGTKVSKVAGLADDLALGLSRKVRIIAPIPGKNRIGFEVPNDHRLAVNLRELVESEEFMKLDVRLPTILGRDIIGRPFFADLASMPHVIVAGATGAGKSVGLNVMLVSLLYRMEPEDLRILMIDPKVVELAPFDRIPHLLFPVVTDMKQASNALKWTVDEMERRYQLFADAGTRNITTYNQWVKRARDGEVPIPRRKGTVEAIAADGSQIEIPTAEVGDVELPVKLPYIVVVVEEFADLMMTQGKEVEASVARLAQKARAAGIHVILATQRPSVDVITGMIKANFPTRVAYRVAQRVDSRTILDQQGAEALLGRGDMLVKLNGENDVKRVQCPFVSEDEVQRVTDHLRAQGEPEYDESIVRGRDDDEEGKGATDAESDPLYDQAVQTVAESGKCSTSWLQRKLGVGYNRAAKIVETMEKNGIVGPPNGSKPREILISAH